MIDAQDEFLTNPFSLKIEHISTEGNAKSHEMASIDFSKINHTNDKNFEYMKIFPETEVMSLTQTYKGDRLNEEMKADS